MVNSMSCHAAIPHGNATPSSEIGNGDYAAGRSSSHAHEVSYSHVPGESVMGNR